MKISLEQLKYNKNKEKYSDGYRIVYFYENHYSIGEYCKTIEGFMIGFAESDPIMDEDDIPKFVSIDDLLNRYLNDIKDAQEIAIYTTDGELIAEKERDINKLNKNRNII